MGYDAASSIPLDHRCPGVGASLLLVLDCIEVIDGNAKGKLPEKFLLQIQHSD